MKLRKNEGPVDRAVRISAGLLLVVAGLFLLDGLQASVVGLVAAAFGVWLVVTGATGVCPGYIPFGFSTLPKTEGTAARLTRPEVPVVPRKREDASR